MRCVMKSYKTTREISEIYNISRQTINTWFKQGLLKKPKKDFRNWYIWSKEDELNLKNILNKKTEMHNAPISKNIELLKINNRRYLGSKSKLLGFIYEVIKTELSEIEVVADIFAGTGVVADMFVGLGKKVIVNDILFSNYISYCTWFGTEYVDIKKVKNIINELNLLKVEGDNYVSKNFGDKYFSLENARKIGGIREQIETYDLNNREKAFLLTSLLYAMDKVANTVGHYDAYRKKMDSFQPIELMLPEYRENKDNMIFCEDANNLVKRIEADLVYIDTPYNSRQYGDAYHLPENIARWEKPRVEGVAKKMIGRNSIKSDYCIKKAPEVFDDLIQNISAKYILVSYNNMAKKGNDRSNAKISNEEIIASLEKKGEVKIFETLFLPFTTGKTEIADHKELLYLCKVGERKKKSEISQKYIKSPLNYMGGKHRLLKQIIPLFPSSIDNFYDVFAGGCNVGINVASKKVFFNDNNKDIIDLYRVIKKYPIDKLLAYIQNIIKEYDLTDTKRYGYDFYAANSSDGLSKVNESNYIMLREDFNNGKFKDDMEQIAFYVLVVYAFNNQIRFNGKKEFNMPPGKRDFNAQMEEKLICFKEAITKDSVYFSNKDFREFITNIEGKNSFVYLDPPYLISNASYNENSAWTEEDEIDLLNMIDELDQRGIKFALSNVFRHKGLENRNLQNWSKKYKVNILNHNYNNSNYQSVANKHKTTEVLITNY